MNSAGLTSTPFGYLLRLVGGLIYWLAVGWTQRSLKSELQSRDHHLMHALISATPRTSEEPS